VHEALSYYQALIIFSRALLIFSRACSSCGEFLMRGVTFASVEAQSADPFVYASTLCGNKHKNTPTHKPNTKTTQSNPEKTNRVWVVVVLSGVGSVCTCSRVRGGALQGPRPLHTHTHTHTHRHTHRHTHTRQIHTHTHTHARTHTHTAY
jgi:hypothetical protein